MIETKYEIEKLKQVTVLKVLKPLSLYVYAAYMTFAFVWRVSVIAANL